MAGGDQVLAEALARVEYKLDILLTILKFASPDVAKIVQPFAGETGRYCPCCQEPVRYTMDLQRGVVVTKCGCSTGMQPPLDPSLMARLNIGGQNGVGDSAQGSNGSADSARGVFGQDHEG